LDGERNKASGADSGGVNARRRDFLRGRFSTPSSPAAPLRPPWARAEEDFLRLCTRCGDCVRACPTRIIVGAAHVFPSVDFRQGACTFCGDCRAACPGGALQPPSASGEAPPWKLRAETKPSCLGHQRVECRICEDQCERAAIRFPPRPGAISLPEIDPERCNGCGACVAPCPVGAINMRAV